MTARTEYEIIEWHKRTFPTATVRVVAEKLVEEAVELAIALGSDPRDLAEIAGFAGTGDDGRPIEELADVSIVLAVLAGRFFGEEELAEAIVEKQRVNARRAGDGRWG